ncbi:hypothetical protein LTR84_008883 [Exophiala bonariae]|uniref:RNA helicase n=1 Tax=Exophiala bonariae TaxID=1690606 RepID=A0AAV9MYG4_9EURO|nr:hypothetical protein LTR84_008883 [Exophiala bonariae]
MASAMRQRRTPARMTLSQDVDRSALESKKSKPTAGPFAGMNQTVAHVRHRRPDQRILSRGRRSIDEKIAVSPRARPARPVTSVEATADSTAPADTDADATSERPLRKKNVDDRPLFHALKMQQALTPLSYTQRDALKAKLERITTFEELGLMPHVTNSVYTQVIPHLTEYSPTPVQKLAIPALLSKKGAYEKEQKRKVDGKPRFDKFLLAAETGSGKTLAYLLPVIDAVKRQEELDRIEEDERAEREAEEKKQQAQNNIFAADPSETEGRFKSNPNMGRPRALILLPSSELVSQVGKVVKLLGHTIKYRSAKLSSNDSPTVIGNSLFNPNGIDIVVSTPHLIKSIAQKEPNILSRVQYLVLDEADSLLDRSFSETSIAIIERSAPSLKQLILCSATIPNSLDRFIDKHFPDTKRIVTPKLHTIPRRVVLGAVDIDKDPYRGSRDLACADIIWQLGKAVHEDSFATHTVKHILVFVNQREKAEEVAKFLATKGIEAVALTRDTTEQRQAEILSSFTAPDRVEGEDKERPKSKKFSSFIPFDDSLQITKDRPTRHLPNTKVLVTTDLGSRGVDTLAVRHVVLYDVPHTTVDFVHRLGRMGRLNRRGRGVVLMGRDDRKDIIREVREAMHKGQALI